MLKTMPASNFWRAPTDNDRGCAMPQRYAQWKIASMYLKLAMRNMVPEPTLHEDGSVSIAYTYGLPTPRRRSAPWPGASIPAA